MLSFYAFRLGIIARILGVFAIAVPFLAQKQPLNADLRTAREEDIREVAFLYLFGVGTGPDPNYPIYCPSVDSDGFKSLQDPSDALMKRFPLAEFGTTRLAKLLGWFH